MGGDKRPLRPREKLCGIFRGGAVSLRGIDQQRRSDNLGHFSPIAHPFSPHFSSSYFHWARPRQHRWPSAGKRGELKDGGGGENVTQANYKSAAERFLPPSPPLPLPPSRRSLPDNCSQTRFSIKGFAVETQTKVFLNELVKSK